MKNLKTLVAVSAVALLSACASPATAPATQAPTPAQIAEQTCKIVVPTMTSLRALAGLPSTAANELAAADKLVSAVCADGVVVNAANLQTLAATALPLISDVVKVAGLTAADQNNIVLGVGAAQIILGAVEDATAQAK